MPAVAHGVWETLAIFRVGHNPQAKRKMKPSSPISYYGDSHNCVCGKVLESQGGISGVLRQHAEKAKSREGFRSLLQPLLCYSAMAEVMEEPSSAHTSLHASKDAHTWLSAHFLILPLVNGHQLLSSITSFKKSC